MSSNKEARPAATPLPSAADTNAKTIEFEKEARELADMKAETVEKAKSPTPVTKPASAEINTDDAQEKEVDEYEAYASNDGTFVLNKLDDATNVEPGNVMENQARHPAHQQHELHVEEDAPGFEQTAALMLPRGSVHYAEGGSVAEVQAGEAAGETTVSKKK